MQYYPFLNKFKDPVLLLIVLVIRDGNLIMDEADIPAGVPLRPPQRPQMYVRKKRIAHAKDFQKFLKVNWFNLKFARFLTGFLSPRNRINMSIWMMSILTTSTKWIWMLRLWIGEISILLHLTLLVRICTLFSFLFSQFKDD